jgi:hypothetical protein
MHGHHEFGIFIIASWGLLDATPFQASQRCVPSILQAFYAFRDPVLMPEGAADGGWKGRIWRTVLNTEFDAAIFSLAVPALGSLIIEPGVR